MSTFRSTSKWSLSTLPRRKLNSVPVTVSRKALLSRREFSRCEIISKSNIRGSYQTPLQSSLGIRRDFAVSSSLRAEKNENFWQVAEATVNEWWLDYESTRPNYEDSGFLDIIYDYHRSRPGNEFKVAHDVAAGAGHTAQSLYYHFDTTVVSDENQISLDAARFRMTEDGLDEENVEFINAPAEQLSDHVDPASADVITIAEALPMLNEDVALEQFARILKPGGTLAAWFYGRPLFSEPEYIEKCQPTWDHIIGKVYAKAIHGGTPGQKIAWQKDTNSVLSWLDNVDLSTSGFWQDVQRYRFNSAITDHPGFFTEATLGTESVPLKRAHSAVNFWNEKLVRVEDTNFWESSWTIEGVRKYIKYAAPGIEEAAAQDEEVQRLVQELAVAMGGEQAERKYTIACALILARRTEKPIF